MIAPSRAAHLRPIFLTDIPRADDQTRRTIETLRSAQFEQDPLFDTADSFRLSLCNSAVKREGKVLEAAIKDAIDQNNNLRLLGTDRRLGRIPDVQFEVISTGWLIALEIKRSAQHDSSKLRQFRSDLRDIPPLLRTALPLFPAENIHFHIVFITGDPPLKEGLRPDDLSRLYGLNIHPYILTARQRYSTAIKQVLKERGL